jgi:hypothetical protein
MRHVNSRVSLGVVVALDALLMAGCAGMITRFECAPGSTCLPKTQAQNKCLAQANAAFSRSKGTIWRQCMLGEGYQEVPCAADERKNPECQVLHVF